jgi:ATP-dependent exoDNAse (exonuclease V) beta subunit
LDKAQRAEFERLLYVVATRPKRGLILVDGEALGADAGSLAEVLGVLPGGAARKWWEGLPEAGPMPAPDEKGATTGTTSAEAAGVGWPEMGAELSPAFYAGARMRAENFTRRVRPSTLARHTALVDGDTGVAERSEPDLFAPPDYPEEQPPPAAAVSYGNWWHGMMETTPWTKGPAAWAAHWERYYDAAPEPERARAEGARMLASPLAKQLSAPGLEFVTELPFLWAEPSEAQAYDGCVDLAAWDASVGRWLVVDWKTDRVEKDAAAELRVKYGAQIAVYARALGAIYGAPVEAYLYSTRAGVAAQVAAE